MSSRLKRWLIGLLIVCGLAIGIWEQLSQDVFLLSDLGMDDIGRQIFCQTVDGSAQKEQADVRFRCEGFNKTTIILSIKTGLPILFGRIKPEEVVEHMKRPYSLALQGFDGLILRGNKVSGNAEEPVPIGEIKTRLERLGAKTIGDMYAAFGFSKFLIRAEEKEPIIFLELTFSHKDYGRNPVQTK